MRRSSNPGYSSDDRVATRAPEFLGYEPTPGMRRVKAQFWVQMREDPSVDPQQLSPADIQRRVDAPSLDRWWRDPLFRSWFLNKQEWVAGAEMAFELWLDQLTGRLMSGLMSDKDLVAAGKLLSEVADKLPRTPSAASKQDPVGQLTPAQAKQKFHELATSLGYLPPPTEDKKGE